MRCSMRLACKWHWDEVKKLRFPKRIFICVLVSLEISRLEVWTFRRIFHNPMSPITWLDWDAEGRTWQEQVESITLCFSM